MIPTDQDEREDATERVIVKATEALNRAQKAVMRAEKAIDAALKAGVQAKEQLALRKKR